MIHRVYSFKLKLMGTLTHSATGLAPWLAAQMGHADWSMIGRVYGRWIAYAAPKAGEKAVEMFAESVNEKAALAGRISANSIAASILIYATSI
jgi:hypothetical protein